MLNYIRIVIFEAAARHWKRHKIFYMILGLSLLLRIPLIFTFQNHVDSDAAVIGVMAKHIMERGEHTIFQFHRPYTGGYSLEAHLAAIAFWLFGISVESLKVVGLFLSLGAIVASYLFTYSCFGRNLALVSTLLFTLATPLVQWNLQMRGAYLEAIIFTALIFTIMFKIIWGRKDTWRHHALFGLLSGLAWWNSEIIIPFLLTCFIIWIFVDRRFFLRISFLVYIFCFLLGSSPTIYYNLTNNFQNIKYVFGSMVMSQNVPASNISFLIWTLDKFSFIKEVIADTLPRFFESDNEWSYFRKISLSSWIQYSIFLLALVRYILNFLSASQWINKKLAILLFISLYLASYCFANPYGPNVHRFLLLLYPYISIIIGELVIDLYKRKEVLKYFGMIIMIFFVIVGEVTYIANMDKHSEWLDQDYKITKDKKRPIEPIFLKTKGETITQVISFLNSQGIKYVNTTFFIKYRLIFESNETIIASSEFFYPEGDSNPFYEDIVRGAGSHSMAIVLYDGSGYSALVKKMVESREIPYRKKRIGEMIVLYPFHGEELFRAIETLSQRRPS